MRVSLIGSSAVSVIVILIMRNQTSIYLVLPETLRSGEKMGTDYECGCRTSGGAWCLCKDHEAELLSEVSLVGTVKCISSISKNDAYFCNRKNFIGKPIATLKVYRNHSSIKGNWVSANIIFKDKIKDYYTGEFYFYAIKLKNYNKQSGGKTNETRNKKLRQS